jgi:hypothetical protein
MAFAGAVEAFNVLAKRNRRRSPPRIGHVCVPEIQSDPAGNQRETGRRLFTNPKNNEAGKQPTLAYRTEVVAVGFDDAEGKVIEASRIVWEGEIDITADEAIAATRATKASRTTAQEFLQIILTNGPVLQTRIIESETSAVSASTNSTGQSARSTSNPSAPAAARKTHGYGHCPKTYQAKANSKMNPNPNRHPADELADVRSEIMRTSSERRSQGADLTIAPHRFHFLLSM